MAPKNEPRRLRPSARPGDRSDLQKGSYVQAPGIRPEASPVDTTVDPGPIRKMDRRELPTPQVARPELPGQTVAPVNSSSGRPGELPMVVRGQTEMQIMAETMGQLLPSVAAFVRYKDTMGELNMKEQATRAVLGLPQSPGHFGDWREDEGYSLGMGEAQGSRFKAELAARLQEVNYGVDPDGSPEKAAAVRREIYDELAQKYLTANQGNKAYLEGFHRHAVEAKVLGDAKGDELAFAQQQETLRANAIQSLEGHLDTELEKVQGLRLTPGKATEETRSAHARFRDAMNDRVNAISAMMGIPKSQANSVYIEALRTRGVSSALNGDSVEANLVANLLASSDSSGFNLRNKKISLNSKEVTEAIKSIRTAIHEAKREAKEQRDSNEDFEMTQAITQIGTGEITTMDQLVALAPRLGSKLPEVERFYNAHRESMSKDLIIESAPVSKRLWELASQGSSDWKDAADKALDARQISPETWKAMLFSHRSTVQHNESVAASRANNAGLAEFKRVIQEQSLRGAMDAKLRHNIRILQSRLQIAVTPNGSPLTKEDIRQYGDEIEGHLLNNKEAQQSPSKFWEGFMKTNGLTLLKPGDKKKTPKSLADEFDEGTMDLNQ